MGVLAYNLLRTLRQVYFRSKDVKRPINWFIKRLCEVGARVSYYGGKWYVRVASAFPLGRSNKPCPDKGPRATF